MSLRLLRIRDHSGAGAYELALLGIASTFQPLGVLASNPLGIVHPERIFGLSLVSLALAVGASLLLMRTGIGRFVAVRWVFIGATMLMVGGPILRHFGHLLGWVIIVITIGLAGALIARLGDHALVRAAVAAMAVVMASGVVISYATRPPVGEDTVKPSPPIEVEMSSTPDIFLVVLDGYPGLQAFELDTGSDRPELRSELERREFRLPDSAWTSYWSTELAIPSILDMSYPVVESGGGLATRQRLYEMIAGDARLVNVLSANGYKTVMLESGWSGSACGSGFDQCVRSPVVDEAVFLSAWSTVVGPYIQGSVGYHFTAGALHAMQWLLDYADHYQFETRPVFVVAHMVVPHPPFFLDESCDVTVSRERSGVLFSHPGVSLEEREKFFEEQVACTDRFMIDFADSVGSEAVVIFVSDHGSDRRNQLVDRGRWSREAIIERMNVLLAARVGDSCDIGDRIVTPNLMRRVLSCHSDSQLADLPDRIFVPDMVELEHEFVEGLMGSAESP